MCTAISSWLFTVLHLFAQAFRFDLHPDNRAGNLQIARLGPDGIRFTAHLLKDKLQPSPDGPGNVGDILPELHEVTAQPGHFLTDIYTLAEDGNPPAQPSLIHRNTPPQSRHP